MSLYVGGGFVLFSVIATLLFIVQQRRISQLEDDIDVMWNDYYQEDDTSE